MRPSRRPGGSPPRPPRRTPPGARGGCMRRRTGSRRAHQRRRQPRHAPIGPAAPPPGPSSTSRRPADRTPRCRTARPSCATSRHHLEGVAAARPHAPGQSVLLCRRLRAGQRGRAAVDQRHLARPGGGARRPKAPTWQNTSSTARPAAPAPPPCPGCAAGRRYQPVFCPDSGSTPNRTPPSSTTDPRRLARQQATAAASPSCPRTGDRCAPTTPRSAKLAISAATTSGVMRSAQAELACSTATSP